MRQKMRRLGPLTAVLAATLAFPTAATADPACVGAGYSLLGSGTDRSVCVPTPFPTANVSNQSGDPSLAQVRVSVDVPFILFTSPWVP